MINKKQLLQLVAEINELPGQTWIGFKNWTGFEEGHGIRMDRKTGFTLFCVPLPREAHITVTFPCEASPWNFRVSVGGQDDTYNVDIFDTEEIPTWMEEIQFSDVRKGFTVYFTGKMQVTIVALQEKESDYIAQCTQLGFTLGYTFPQGVKS